MRRSPSSSSDLRRSLSNTNLKDNMSSSSTTDPNKPPAPPAPPAGGFGLKRSASRPSLLSQSSSTDGGLGLRRTGSKMSLSDLAGAAKAQSSTKLGNPAKQVPPPAPTQAQSYQSHQQQTNANTNPASPGEERSQISNYEGSIPSPPVSPGMPRLHRSRSMNNFDMLKAPAVSEGQMAVEQISGKVELPQVAASVKPSAVPPSMMQDEVTERGAVLKMRTPPDSVHQISSGTSGNSGTSGTSGTSSRRSSNSSEIPSAALIAAANHMAPGQSPHDDGDLRPEPESRVDYFSHNWNEADIAGSWRYIISRRQDMANSARLENASWRMWAKAKNNLRTISPAAVNWLKDYDVTWLYGPLYHEPDNVYSRSPGSRLGSTPGTPDAVASSSSNSSGCCSNSGGAGIGSLLTPGSGAGSGPSSSSSDSRRLASLYDQRADSHNARFYPKSILKKKTLAQLMLEEAQELENNSSTGSRNSSHVRSTANYLRHHHYRPTPYGPSRQAVANILNRQYQPVPPIQNVELSSSQETGHQPQHQPSQQQQQESASLSQETPGADSNKVAAGMSPSASSNTLSKNMLYDLAGSGQLASGASSRASSQASSRAGSRAGSQLSFRTRPGSLLSLRSSYASSMSERRVHFNDRVEQCIAVDPESENSRPNISGADNQKNPLSDSESDDDDGDDDDYDDDDDDDNGGGLFLGLRRPSMLDVHPEGEAPRIIAALPATTLKLEEHDDQSSCEDEEYRNEDPVFGSRSRRPGFNAQYVPHSVQSYEIVDPEIHPVKFEAKGVSEEVTKPNSRSEPTASFA